MSSALSNFFAQPARSVTILLTFKGVDISATVAPYLRDFVYHDNLSFKADNLEFELADPARVFIQQFAVAKGQKIVAKLQSNNWDTPGHIQIMELGSFEIDQVEFNFPTTYIRVKCTSVPVSGTLKWQPKHRAWEGQSLKGIAAQIAGESQLSLMYEAKTNPTIKRKDQDGESDLVFLSKLCEEQGLCLKITNLKMVIFDEAIWEQNPPVALVKLGDPTQGTVTGVYDTSGQSLKCGIVSGRIDTTAQDVYKASAVAYQNPATGKTIKQTFPGSGDLYDPPTGVAANLFDKTRPSLTTESDPGTLT